MTFKAVTFIKIFLLFIVLTPTRLLAEETIEDFFAMSPAELAMVPVSIATGTPKPIGQPALVTSINATGLTNPMKTSDLDQARGMSNENSTQMLICEIKANSSQCRTQPAPTEESLGRGQ